MVLYLRGRMAKFYVPKVKGGRLDGVDWRRQGKGG